MMDTVYLFSILLTSVLTGATGSQESPAWPYREVYPAGAAEGTSTLTFALMLSFGGDYKSNGAIPGVKLALDQINDNPDILPGYTLQYTLTDSQQYNISIPRDLLQCDRTTALNAFFQQMVAPPTKLAWIGSGCSIATEPTAEITHFYNITQLSCVSSSSVLAEREQFQSHFQLLATEANIVPAFYAIIKEFEWKYVAIIQQNENLFTKTMAKLTDLFTEDGVEYSEKSFLSEQGIEGLGDEPFDPQARIFILAMYAVHARPLLCEAYRLGFHYPRYMFLTYGWYEPEWWKGDSPDRYMDDCLDEHRESVLPQMLAPLQFEYLSDTSTTIDSGINGSQFESFLSEDYYIYSQQCYDATWALAYALDKTITDLEGDDVDLDVFGSASGINDTPQINHFTYQNDVILRKMLEHLENTDFIGITGRIQFNPSSGVRDVDRLEVHQYRYVDQGHLELMQIGTVTKMEGTNESYIFEYIEGAAGTTWPDGLIPYDGVPVERDVTVHIGLTILFFILATGGIVFTVCSLIFNFVFRKRTPVHLMSPNLNYLIGAGAIILYIAVYFFVYPTTNPDVVTVLCSTTLWLVSIGYSLCYGTILVKMARIYYLFNHPTLIKKNSIRDLHLAVVVLFLLVFDVVILVIYTAVEESQGNLDAIRVPNQENTRDVEGELEIIYDNYIWVCSSKPLDYTLGILYGYKGSLQVIAMLFAFQIRKVKIMGLNDAKYIAAAIYVTSIVVAVAMVSTYTLRDFVNVHAAMFGTGFWLGTTISLGLVFIPKMVGVYRDLKGKNTLSDQSSADVGYVGMKHDEEGQRESIEAMKKKITELEGSLSRRQSTGDTNHLQVEPIPLTQRTSRVTFSENTESSQESGMTTHTSE